MIGRFGALLFRVDVARRACERPNSFPELDYKGVRPPLCPQFQVRLRLVLPDELFEVEVRPFRVVRRQDVLARLGVVALAAADRTDVPSFRVRRLLRPPQRVDLEGVGHVCPLDGRTPVDLGGGACCARSRQLHRGRVDNRPPGLWTSARRFL